ncbi:MAG: hypothetical protein HY240_00440 [Actinobacteria bacterium]|nr:hypothetical protein [Actinomycetota bacterium]
MTHIRSRRLFAALTIAVALTASATVPQPVPASAGTLRSSVSSRLCDYRWKDGPRQVKRLIRCAAHRWPVSGGPDKAVSVARCESRFRPKAYNAAGYAGVFQQSTYYWPKRSRKFGFPKWSAFNGRANIIVSIRMAHRHGWGAWSCA